MSTTNTNYSRGSEWRKWDLHVHSPHTFMENNFNNCSDEDFINQIKKKEVEVIGLTNYFKFSDEEFDLKNKLQKQGVTTLLNLEIRLDYQNKDDECLDLHVIFAESVQKEEIQPLLNNLDVNIGDTTKKLQL